jgi:hypothetical protein
MRDVKVIVHVQAPDNVSDKGIVEGVHEILWDGLPAYYATEGSEFVSCEVVNGHALNCLRDHKEGTECPTVICCKCLPGQVCVPCAARGYKNGLAGYAERIYPDRVTEHDIDKQERTVGAGGSAGEDDAVPGGYR